MMRRPSMRALALAVVATLAVAAPATASSPALSIKNDQPQRRGRTRSTVTVQTPDPGATPAAYGDRERPDRRRRAPVGRPPVRSRSRHRHLSQHAGPEADRCDRGGDHVRHGRPVERHARRLRLRREAVSLGRASGHLCRPPRAAWRRSPPTATWHRHLRRRQDGRAGPGRTAGQPARARPAHRRLVRARLGDLRAGRGRGQVGPCRHLRGQHRRNPGGPERPARAGEGHGRRVPAGDRPRGAHRRVQPDLGCAREHVHVHVSQPGAEGQPDPARGQRSRPAVGAGDRDGSGHARGERRLELAPGQHAHERDRPCRGCPRRIVPGAVGALLLLSFRPGVAVGKRIAAYTEPKRKAAHRAARRRPDQDQHAEPAVRGHREDRRLVQLLEAHDTPARAGRSAAAHGRDRLHPDGRRAAPGHHRALRARLQRACSSSSLCCSASPSRPCSSGSWPSDA